MKQLVIILGTVILGCLIFNMMVGNQEGSLKSISAKSMERALEEYE